ncbi:glycosyltransferase [Actinomyces vulturis]|uniref:glycosyltransferase n=1 Tax=Actinomyces vulturis TaxID=1857645 RepID=UPI000835A1A0|nr:glycosyltransferase [Actinomyces vulturis]
MNITVVTTWLPTAVAPSSGSFVVNDCTAIHQAGADVRIIHLVPPHQDDGTRHVMLNGMKVLRIPFTPSSPASVLAVYEPLRRALEGSTIVHSMAMSSLIPLTVLDICGEMDTHWVHTEHWSGLTNPDTLGPVLTLGRHVIERLEQRPDVVTAVCEYLAQPLSRLRHAAPTVVVPCIVEPRTDLTPSPLSTEQIAMVSVGGLVERKNPMMCLETLEALLALGQDATMTFVGDGPLRAMIDDYCASRSQLAQRVTITGIIPHHQVPHYLADADVFIGPTRGDNFFVSAAEAIVSGRPVVVSDAGGQTEYVTDTNGRILPIDANAEQWAHSVVECVTLARSQGKESAQAIAATIGDRFSSSTVGQQYCDIYRQLL